MPRCVKMRCIMYRILHSSMPALPDVAAFVDTLNTLGQNSTPAARGLFDPGAELVVTRAPGRLDLMGGFGDYSGSLVLQLPIREAALVALQPDAERVLRIVSLGAEANHRAASFTMSLADFETPSGPVDYATACAFFKREKTNQWAAYVAGAFLVLMRKRGVRFDGGARILISSQVPEGKGVSSSAAIEVAVMKAIAAAFDIHLEARDLGLLCQKVENLIVGAPCGVMDQMTSACGESGRLLALLCQPAELQGMVPLTEDIVVWGLDSGVRHSVSGADYGSVRVGAYMGYRIIAEIAGLKCEPGNDGGPVRVHDPVWHGYLTNLSPSQWEQGYAARVPEMIQGSDFLQQYSGTTDTVTQVQPERSYAVRVPTAHPIYENFRVRAFIQLLNSTHDERRLELLGELMYQAHAGYMACGLGEPNTDRIVQLVRQAGSAQGLYGAKITGGGSGGSVAVLGRRGADAAIAAIAAQYESETGHRPYIFTGSSPGAAAFGHLKLQ